MGFLESFARLEQCGGNDGRSGSGQNDIATDSLLATTSRSLTWHVLIYLAARRRKVYPKYREERQVSDYVALTYIWDVPRFLMGSR